jgi:hypothetical protein
VHFVGTIIVSPYRELIGPMFGGSYEGHKFISKPECIDFLNVEPGNIVTTSFKGTSQVTCSTRVLFQFCI